MAAKSYTSIDPLRLGRAVVVLVYFQMAGEVGQILSYAYAMGAPSAQTPLGDGLTSGDLVISLAALAYLAAWLIGGIVGLKWIYRVNRNAHSFARGLSVSPPWAVGWYFVPIASLWKPYEAVSEAWQASERPARWKSAPKPSFLGWWWALWLISTFVSNIGGVMARYTTDVGVIGPVTILGSLLGIWADLLFIRLVQGLSDLQHRQINYGVFDEEPDATTAAQVPGIIGVG